MIQETLEKRGAEVDAIYELSKIVDAGLDRKVIELIMELIEFGVNPESLADSKFEHNNLFTNNKQTNNGRLIFFFSFY